MTIEILYFPGCPNYLPAVKLVQHALKQEGVSAEIEHVQVLDSAAAAANHFFGSPTVRINGVDVEPSARSGGASGLCCRTYRGESSPEGVPSLALIRGAIREIAKPGKKDGCVQE